MTYEQFWEQDVELVKFYREADKIKTDRKNFECWLQGLYVYEAICDASPILHAFAKKGTKAIPYRDQPYDLRSEKKAVKKKEQKRDSKAKSIMEMWMVSVNKKFEQKGGGGNS